jgi:molybdate transport system ATP-binding protein
MDEPFAAVDETLRSHLHAEVQRVQRRYNIPLLLVTHNLDEAYFLADQLVVVDQGRVVQADTRDVVFRKPINPSVARLMGMSNVFSGIVVKIDSGKHIVACQGIEFIVDSPESLTIDDRVHLGLRPEEVIFIREGRPIQEELEENLFEGVITGDQAQGFDHLVTATIQLPNGGSHDIHARVPHPVFMRLGLSIGDLRTLSIKSSSIHVFPN